MAMRCSLLGHDYGDPQVSHERDQRGSEVVVTMTEFERCTRCGKKHVISENTEVKSVGPDPGAERDDVTPETEGTVPEPASEDSVEAGDPESGADGRDDADRAETTSEIDETAPSLSDPDAETVTDDGEILEDGPEAPDRGHGEWPAADDVGPPVAGEEPTAWPDADRNDSATAGIDAGGSTDRSPAEYSSTDVIDPSDDRSDPETASHAVSESDASADTSRPATDESTPVSGGSGGARPADRTGATEQAGETAHPDTSDPHAGADTAAVGDSTGADPDGRGVVVEPESSAEATGGVPPTEEVSGIKSGQSAPAPGEAHRHDGVATEFYCPQCGYVASGDRGSLRTGDICPHCKKGYLGERER